LIHVVYIEVPDRYRIGLSILQNQVISRPPHRPQGRRSHILKLNSIDADNGTIVSTDLILARTCPQDVRIVSLTAKKPVIAVTATKDIIARLPIEFIVSGGAIRQHIIPGTAEHRPPACRIDNLRQVIALRRKYIPEVFKINPFIRLDAPQAVHEFTQDLFTGGRVIVNLG